MSVRWSRSSRLAAAALAVLLSGAPRLALGRTAAGTCHCRHGQPAAPCACPKHRAQGAAGSQHGPTCHGHAKAAPTRDARPAGLATSCLNTCCGGSEERAASPAGTDLFTVPDHAGIAYVPGTEPAPMAFPRELDRAHEPDVPPPRPA